MLTQTRGRVNRGGRSSAPVRISSQGYTVPRKYGQLYRHKECFACHHYGKFVDKFADKQPKEINLAMIGLMIIQNADVIKKTLIILDT